MGAVYFYHLERRPLEMTLPMLIGKAQDAGWRVVVRATDTVRAQWLDDRLWRGDDAGFLPHGLAGSGFDADQPVLLTTTQDVPNGAACVMAVDGAAVSTAEVSAMERVCILFDGNDEAALQHAREQWKALTDAGCSAQYWTDADGSWQMKAER